MAHGKTLELRAIPKPIKKLVWNSRVQGTYVKKYHPSLKTWENVK